MNKKHIKTLCLVVCGNILDYYDFLLFAHLGHIITTFFVPDLSASDAHLLGLLLFATPFIIRPIGGYIFGKVSDLRGRSFALSETLKYASLASLGVAILPAYEQGGIICSWIFFLLRSMQGLSLGGEYPTAGTFLMEKYSKNQGLISGILVASGTVGSLFAFSFSYLYIQGYFTGHSWRIAFVLGSIATYISYYLRKKNINQKLSSSVKSVNTDISYAQSLFLTLLIGALVGVSCWIPMVYVNFYLTKIMHLPLNYGLKATFISLITYVICNPLFGHIADKYTSRLVMTIGAILLIPLSIIGSILITNELLVGQVFLTIGASIFGSSIHVIMNQLFPSVIRSRSLNTTFMIGASFGGLTPFVAGYFADHYNFHGVPLVMIVTISFITFVTFYYFFYKKI